MQFKFNSCQLKTFLTMYVVLRLHLFSLSVENLCSSSHAVTKSGIRFKIFYILLSLSSTLCYEFSHTRISTLHGQDVVQFILFDVSAGCPNRKKSCDLVRLFDSTTTCR